jgi:hypothetical protein
MKQDYYVQQLADYIDDIQEELLNINHSRKQHKSMAQ